MVLETLRWVVASSLGVVWVIIASFNGRGMMHSLLARRMGFVIPFIGGLVGLIGVVVCPLLASNRWLWVPLVLDVGTLPLLVFAAATTLSRKFAEARQPR